MAICHRLNMKYLKRKCPVGVDQNILPSIHAGFQALTCSGYKPFVRQYSLNSISVNVDVSKTTENFSSFDHLSDELTFDTLKPDVLNRFCQLYGVEILIPSCCTN